MGWTGRCVCALTEPVVVWTAACVAQTRFKKINPAYIKSKSSSDPITFDKRRVSSSSQSHETLDVWVRFQVTK